MGATQCDNKTRARLRRRCRGPPSDAGSTPAASTSAFAKPSPLRRSSRLRPLGHLRGPKRPRRCGLVGGFRLPPPPPLPSQSQAHCGARPGSGRQPTRTRAATGPRPSGGSRRSRNGELDDCSAMQTRSFDSSEVSCSANAQLTARSQRTARAWPSGRDRRVPAARNRGSRRAVPRPDPRRVTPNRSLIRRDLRRIRQLAAPGYFVTPICVSSVSMSK